MALICRDLRRFACSLSLFHPGGTPLPLPPFVHPSARLSVRPPVSSLSLSFGRGTRFPFHPTNPFRPISIFTHRFRVWCNRDERPRKGYRVTQKTLEIDDRRAEEEEEMYRSLFSLSPVHPRVPPFPFLVLNEGKGDNATRKIEGK